MYGGDGGEEGVLNTKLSLGDMVRTPLMWLSTLTTLTRGHSSESFRGLNATPILAL